MSFEEVPFTSLLIAPFRGEPVYRVFSHIQAITLHNHVALSYIHPSPFMGINASIAYPSFNLE